MFASVCETADANWSPSASRSRLRVARSMIEREDERHARREEHRQQDAEMIARSSRRHDREDAARRGRELQTRLEQHVRRDARHAARDEGEDEDRLHQREREVDLVDAADELDDRPRPVPTRARRRCRRT